MGILATWGKKLSKHTHLIKIRSDTFIFSSLASPKFMIKVKPGLMYMRSDHAFYAEASTFIAVWDGFYQSIPKTYLNMGEEYTPLNFDNLLRSDPLSIGYRNNAVVRYKHKTYGKDLGAMF